MLWAQRLFVDASKMFSFATRFSSTCSLLWIWKQQRNLPCGHQFLVGIFHTVKSYQKSVRQNLNLGVISHTYSAFWPVAPPTPCSNEISGSLGRVSNEVDIIRENYQQTRTESQEVKFPWSWCCNRFCHLIKFTFSVLLYFLSASRWRSGVRFALVAMERCCAMGMGEGQYVLSQISAWDPRFLILLIILFYFNTFHPSFQRCWRPAAAQETRLSACYEMDWPTDTAETPYYIESGCIRLKRYASNRFPSSFRRRHRFFMLLLTSN